MGATPLDVINEYLRQQKDAYVYRAFKTRAGKEVISVPGDADAAEMLQKLEPLISFIEQAVERAVEAKKWKVELGDYHGEPGICPIIKRVPVEGHEFNTSLHGPSHAAFNAWAQKHFDCRRMYLHDFEHPEGSHTLELVWTPLAGL